MASIRFTKSQFRKLDGARVKDTPVHKKLVETYYETSTTIKIERQWLLCKPRMSQSDRWKKRPCVENYFAQCDKIKDAWRAVSGKLYIQKVKIYCHFYLKGKENRDFSNLLKGVEDALKGLAYPDDCVRWLVGCDGVDVTMIDKKSKMETIEITIRPVLGGNR